MPEFSSILNKELLQLIRFGLFSLHLIQPGALAADAVLSADGLIAPEVPMTSMEGHGVAGPKGFSFARRSLNKQDMT